MGNSARKVHTGSPCPSSRRKPRGWWACNLAHHGSLCCSRSKSRSVFYYLPRVVLSETSDYGSLRCHSFPACVHVQLLQSWQSDCLWPCGLQSARFFCPWDSPGKSGLPCPTPGDLLHPRIKPESPASPALQANSLPTELPRKPHSFSEYHLSSSFEWSSLRRIFITQALGLAESSTKSQWRGIFPRKCWSDRFSS